MKTIRLLSDVFFFRSWIAFPLFCLLANGLGAQSNIQQSVSINADGSAAHASALLDLGATDKGMLVPRLTSSQRTAIASPATGLLVFDTDAKSFWFYTGLAWAKISPQTFIADTDGNTTVQVEEIANEDVIRFDLGGTESMVLRKNTSGHPRLELKSVFSNTFMGTNAGSANTTGNFNTAYGVSALASNLGGNFNTACGVLALSSNINGSSNTAQGRSSLATNASGSSNTAVGELALFSNTSGSSNTGIGRFALVDNTTGNSNTANGYNALGSNTTGFSNVGIGTHALLFNTIRPNLVAVGDSALLHNGVGASMAIHGAENTALGSKALFENTIGFKNLAVGTKALYSNTGGDYNTASGCEALYGNTSGNNNTANGHVALYSNTDGESSTAIGNGALFNSTTGDNNTAIGEAALFGNVAGSQNIAFGVNAYFTGPNLNNTACLGYNSGGLSNVSNRMEIGNTSVSFIGGQVNWGTYSDARIKTQVQENVPGLAFITRLRPVTYHLDIHKQNDLCLRGKKDTGEWEGKYDIEQKQMTGFIAQEVAAAANAIGYDFSGVEKGADEVGLYSVKYAEFVVPLVKAVQEQQALIQSLQDENAAQKAENAALRSQLDKITAALSGAGIAVEQ